MAPPSRAYVNPHTGTPLARYFKPLSTCTVTTRWPGPRRRARVSAATRLAPVEGPEKTPSVRAARTAIAGQLVWPPPDTATHDPQRVPLHGAHQRQRRAGAPTGVLHDHLANRTTGVPPIAASVPGARGYRLKAWNSAIRTCVANGLAVVQSVRLAGSLSCSP